jgi:hypothetical protein
MHSALLPALEAFFSSRASEVCFAPVTFEAKYSSLLAAFQNHDTEHLTLETEKEVEVAALLFLGISSSSLSANLSKYVDPTMFSFEIHHGLLVGRCVSRHDSSDYA